MFETEWVPDEDVVLVHPKVGICAAATTINHFSGEKIGNHNMSDIISFMNHQALRMCGDEHYLKSESNKLMRGPPFADNFMKIIDFVNNLRQSDLGMGSAEDAARITLALYCPQLFNFDCEDCVKVGESSIHGKGLFASRSTSPGEIVTVYPSSIIRFGDAENEQVLAAGSYAPKLDKYAFNTKTMLRCYKAPIQILPSTERCEQPRAGQMGHLANAANTDTGLLALFDEKINCFALPILAGTCIALIANKHIDTGTEILIHYAMGYDWNTDK